MIQIVGTKIIMPRCDDGAFRIKVIDQKGVEVELTDRDTVTLRMQYSLNPDISLTKEAIVIPNGDKTFHIIKFISSDTKRLLEGDYYYDVILEHGDRRFTIVSTSVLSLRKSISLDDLDDNVGDDVSIFDANNIDYDAVMSATPLIGRFNAVKYDNPDKSIGEEDDTLTESETVMLLDDDLIEF